MKYIDELSEGTTKEDLVKQCPELENQSFDYALPQNWTNEIDARFIDVSYGTIISSFVWLYPKGSTWGQPHPLTLDGIDILSKLAAAVRIVKN